ncbi:MAG: fumarylacetoacetate hydrolase family protein [Synechococcales cyanobacterium K44_A2020_017]|jgi:2-keto-4-pentenoate hydratase/2-oxohepta-3-ene-1,7-dioic acid hydratase in catechol pathway|uniref:fumarylacetoacetate hydrolase family protein n=1 Tax=Leptolyngbya sp. CCY15150 TaxID=2767772 RepID=UPI001950F1E6|nr:fumarylacetoacetate hydrolase family protein [Leptolyngbya sp. CCY15150]MBF2087330.1 fumarylacetoacetate hydrolase family protein [Synechococcales cyanobacterium K32_A2020_035]MBF2096419.1 fumarylacetoacetate hydrolase family protein [Synechococcales cyanobacterium K44_A2020_017]
MAQRYVRVKTPPGQLYYGLLHLDRQVQILDAPPWLGGQLTEQFLNPDEFDVLAPCAPSKIVAIGKNYAKHAAEMGTPVPEEPLIFMKPPTAVIATGHAIEYPPQSQRIDYEGELALVIGDRCFNCTPEQARSKIWGYTIAIDVTARDLQQRDNQWVRAKGFDTFCPLGPWIVRELSAGAMLQTFLNQQKDPVQCASIDTMVVSPEQLVSYISRVMTLLPGDVVLTGTPEGVGPLQVGDVIRVEVEGIGSLESSVIARPEPDSNPSSSEDAIAP